MSRLKHPLALLSVALLLASCANTGSNIAQDRNPDAVIGKVWQWEATVTPVEQLTVSAPERYTLQLQADGRALIRFDCNRGGGSYQIEIGRLSFGPTMSTRMACPPESLDHRYAQDLARISSFFVEGSKLYLELPADSGSMRFRSGN